MFVVGSDLLIRFSMYRSVLWGIISGNLFSGAYLGFLLVTFFAPVFFIIYGLVYFKRHSLYAVSNLTQYKLYKIILLLIPINFTVIVTITFLHLWWINTKINDATDKNNILICKELNEYSFTKKCISTYIDNNPIITECSKLSDDFTLELICTNEVNKYSKDWDK
ncbi:MAG TPA: hypothetical protein PLS49_08185 [Candidatus Woesebacteria bacterium]|nr:hypothetical protein [Candidatus Woesebacteria bacterium]